MLKRLEDAVRHGDRIYSVIKALTASSDGRARSVFAPRSEGQVKAMKRAYERAAVSPADIQLIEAHGTGTQSGDNTELKSLQAVFSGLNITDQSIALGSIKSQIGHTRRAAGAAALMKVSLALPQKVLPPTINVKVAADSIDPMFYVNTESRSWIRPANGKPRRAALSAFGFGGTNYHAILEEYASETSEPYRLNGQSAICVWHASSVAELLVQCNSARSELGGASAEAAFKELERASNAKKIPLDDARIVFVANDATEAVQLLAEAIKQLQARPEVDWEHPRGIYCRRRGTNLAGRIVALFPGQGSQYVDMARGLAMDYPEIRRVLDGADAVAFALRLPALSAAVYPPPALSADVAARQAAELTRTVNAQPAIGAVSAGYFRLLQRMSFKPDFVAGHSYGEIAALWCAIERIHADGGYLFVEIGPKAVLAKTVGGDSQRQAAPSRLSQPGGERRGHCAVSQCAGPADRGGSRAQRSGPVCGGAAARTCCENIDHAGATGRVLSIGENQGAPSPRIAHRHSKARCIHRAVLALSAQVASPAAPS